MSNKENLLKQQIDAFDLQMSRLRSEISDVIDKKRNLLFSYYTEKKGIYVGCIVVQNNVEYKVTSMNIRFISSAGFGDLELKGVTRNKNLAWGKREYKIYGRYEVLKDEA